MQALGSGEGVGYQVPMVDTLFDKKERMLNNDRSETHYEEYATGKDCFLADEVVAPPSNFFVVLPKRQPCSHPL